MLNFRILSRAAFVPLWIMVRHCSCSRNLFLPSFLFPSTLFHIYWVLPDVFLSLHRFLYLPTLFLPPLQLSGPLHVTLPCHISPAWAPISKLSAKWGPELVDSELQLVKHRGCKGTVFVRGRLRHQVKYESFQPGNVCVCYYLPVCWWAAYWWLLLARTDSTIFCFPDIAKGWENYF